MADNEEPILTKHETPADQTALLFSSLKRWQWWFLVAINILFLLVGQAAAVILGRFYYDQGGNSKWMATLVQTAGFPLLFLPLYLLPAPKNLPHPENLPPPQNLPPLKLIASIYLVLGVVIAGDNMLYSVGLMYLSASTYSLICATQLAFNAVFSYFINAQRFTALILNSVVVLSLSAALIAVSDGSAGPTGVSRKNYFVGFVSTLGASAMYSLLLSLMQFSFQKVLRRETFSVVLEMQIYTSLVATCASAIGLFASGEWEILGDEMRGFGRGGFVYVMVLVWTAVAWQVCSVGVVGLIFVVSSLFSNVISTMSLAVTPIAAVVVFGDGMNGAKIVAMLMAIWGSGSYVYQNYIDDRRARKARPTVGSVEPRSDSLC